MPKLSRRKLITSAVAAPLALKGSTPSSDAIVAAVVAWMIERANHDAMAEEWGDLEGKLLTKTRDKMAPAQARHSKLPEARAMRALDKRIAACWKRLERDARKIVLMRPVSAQGALAKIRLAVRIQGPYDWHEEYVYALVQDGCEQLALILARAG